MVKCKVFECFATTNIIFVDESQASHALIHTYADIFNKGVLFAESLSVVLEFGLPVVLIQFYVEFKLIGSPSKNT